MASKILIKNSLTRKLEPFEPLNPPDVNMYTCGVTVYDECHIGHARSLYVFDVMRRYLEYKGFKVNFVRNITDIDDKIINRANELKVDWKELVDKYIESYREDLKLLGIRPGMPDKDKEEPRATKNIDDIKKYIQVLIDKKYAYVTNSGVYFSVRKFKEYGKLSGQSVDQMLTGVRKESDETKEDPLDFALWKTSKPGEPSWPSTWGEGRPGWHIECSVMSTKYLKTDTLDIHAGGRDLIFPHHENEIAQSEAKSEKQFAKYWIHHGLLTINGQKMAKSLGNFITVRDALKDFYAEVLKGLFLQTHYSMPLNYSQKGMNDARIAVKALFVALTDEVGLEDSRNLNSSFKDEIIDSYKCRFDESMDNDFNTAQAIAEVFKMGHHCNKLLSEYKIKKTKELGLAIIHARNTIRKLCGDIFGFNNYTFDVICHDPKWSDPEWRAVIEKSVKDVKWIDGEVASREKLRKEKKYAEADEIRKKLEQEGVVIKDTDTGPMWEWR